MKKIGLITIVLSILMIVPAEARKDKAAKGVVVVGVLGTSAPTLIWRQFDPSTGKLLSFSTVQNVGDNVKKSLSGLFGALGRAGRADKRYTPNEAGVSYRMAELPPGVYVLEAVNTDNRMAVFEGSVPIVRITARQTSYVGDYTIQIIKGEGGRTIAAGRTLSGAQAFLATFPKIKSPLSADSGGTATLDCKGKGVAFASQLVCDSDLSLVSDIVFSPAGS